MFNDTKNDIDIVYQIQKQVKEKVIENQNKNQRKNNRKNTRGRKTQYIRCANNDIFPPIYYTKIIRHKTK